MAPKKKQKASASKRKRNDGKKEKIDKDKEEDDNIQKMWERSSEEQRILKVTYPPKTLIDRVYSEFSWFFDEDTADRRISRFEEVIATKLLPYFHECPKCGARAECILKGNVEFTHYPRLCQNFPLQHSFWPSSKETTDVNDFGERVGDCLTRYDKERKFWGEWYEPAMKELMKELTDYMLSCIVKRENALKRASNEILQLREKMGRGDCRVPDPLPVTWMKPQITMPPDTSSSSAFTASASTAAASTAAAASATAIPTTPLS